MDSLLNVFLVATGLIRLALPILVAYALLRHQLFDIDLKLRWGIEKGTVGGVFAGAFLIASEGLEQFVPVEGTLLGILAAVGIALALKPIQTVAERLATRLLPGTQPIEELDQEEGLDLYREQAQIIWRDDVITDKERAVLDNMRERLGISDDAANRIEKAAKA